AGFFGGKTTVITDHPTWVIVDVEAKSLGKNGEIAIAVRAKGEEPFFPTPKERKKKIAQITKGGGPVDISGSITADANGFARANEKIIQEYVNPSGGYELSCLNQTSPEVVEAGQTSKTITFSFEGKPVVETLSAPGPLTFAVKVSVRGSE
ncbi:MAG: hypothetical protein SFV81_28870, partial [Pirellulaceae bacterium]|nr:hypothetical protein [Pirellulaceae bacterium]